MAEKMFDYRRDFLKIAITLSNRYEMANVQDGEDAIQNGIARLLRLHRPLIGSHVFNEARSNLRDMLKRKERGNISIDAIGPGENYDFHDVAVQEIDFLGLVRLREVARG